MSYQPHFSFLRFPFFIFKLNLMFYFQHLDTDLIMRLKYTAGIKQTAISNRLQ